jgi:hypothetical protein
MPERRFSPPRTAEETDACFIVRDHSRRALAYVYFEEEPGRRAAAKLLTRDEPAVAFGNPKRTQQTPTSRHLPANFR